MWRNNPQQQQQQQQGGSRVSGAASRSDTDTSDDDDNVVTVSEIFELKQDAIDHEEKMKISGRSTSHDDDNNGPGLNTATTNGNRTAEEVASAAAMATKPGAFAVSGSSVNAMDCMTHKIEQHNAEQQHGNQDAIELEEKMKISGGCSSTDGCQAAAIETSTNTNVARRKPQPGSFAISGSSFDIMTTQKIEQHNNAKQTTTEGNKQQGQMAYHSSVGELVASKNSNINNKNYNNHHHHHTIRKKQVPAPPELSASSHPFVNPNRRRQQQEEGTHFSSTSTTSLPGSFAQSGPLSPTTERRQQVHLSSTASLPGAFAQSGPGPSSSSTPMDENDTAERRSSAVEEVMVALAQEEEQQQNGPPSGPTSASSSLRHTTTTTTSRNNTTTTTTGRPPPTLPTTTTTDDSSSMFMEKEQQSKTEEEEQSSSNFLMLRANAISDVEAVFEAEEVQRDFYHRNQLLIVITCIVIGILFIVTLSIVLTRPPNSRNSSIIIIEEGGGIENRTGDPRCWVPIENQSVILRCICDNTTNGFLENELSTTEQGFYHLGLIQFDLLGIINKTDISNVDSCHPSNIVGLVAADVEKQNVTIEEISMIPRRVQIYIFTLMYLYVTMNGLDWNLEEAWFSNMDVCSWTGVDCMFVNVIHRLSLSNMGLRGQIPTELQYLNTLRFLDLSDNTNITGTIPSELVKLSSLMTFDLSRNGLTGRIPMELLALTQLDTLRLSSNHLTGSIPVLPSSSSSSNGGNTTTFTPIVSLADAEISLRSMDLSRNLMTGSIPSRIGYMTRLQWLRLEENQFSGVLPTELGIVTTLEMLNLGNNRFTGTIPEFLGFLPRLVMLNLYESGFTGKIPESFCGGGATTTTTTATVPSNSVDVLSRFRQIVVDCRLTEDCSCCSRIPQDATATVEVQCGESLPDFAIGL